MSSDLGGRIAAFSTHMTGEMFAALRGSTILGRTMRDGAPDGPWFDAGVRRSGDAGGVAHHAFGVRAEHLAGRLPEDAGPAYLSGILVGHEVRAELGPEPVHLIGAAGLTGLYARAIELCGGSAVVLDPDAAARGLARIGATVDWG